LYSQIETTLWGETWWQETSQGAKFLYLYLRTNDHRHLSGLYEITDRTARFETDMEAVAYERALAELVALGQVKRDGALVWIVEDLKRRPEATLSPKIVRAVAKQVERHRGSPLAAELLRKYSKRLKGIHTLPITHGKGKDTVGIPSIDDEDEGIIKKVKPIQSSMNPTATPSIPYPNPTETGDEFPALDGPWAGIPAWMVSTNPEAEPGALQKAFPRYNYTAPSPYLVDRVADLLTRHPRAALEKALKICGENAAHSITYLDKVLANGHGKAGQKPKAQALGPKPSSKFAYNPKTGETRLYLPNKGDKLQPGEELV